MLNLRNLWKCKAEPLGDISRSSHLPVEKEMSDACVAQWLEQSTGNRKNLGLNPSAVKSVFFPQKDFKFLKLKLKLKSDIKISTILNTLKNCIYFYASNIKVV